MIDDENIDQAKPLPEPIVLPEPTQLPEDIVGVELPEVAPEKKHPKLRKDEFDYLFEVPQPEDNDIYTDDLVEVPDEEDLSDLVTVTNEDIMGVPPKVARKQVKFKRTEKRYTPPTSLGGMR